jgi:hypothetical protein
MITFLIVWFVSGFVGGLVLDHWDTINMNKWLNEPNTKFHIEPMWVKLYVIILFGIGTLIYAIYISFKEEKIL